MKTYIFKKETKGFSVSIDGSKASYGGAFSFVAYPNGSNADIKINESGKIRRNDLSIDVTVDSVTVGVTLFAGTATALIDSLRDTVFFN
jgi:hypothetical protein